MATSVDELNTAVQVVGQFTEIKIFLIVMNNVDLLHLTNASAASMSTENNVDGRDRKRVIYLSVGEKHDLLRLSTGGLNYNE